LLRLLDPGLGLRSLRVLDSPDLFGRRRRVFFECY